MTIVTPFRTIIIIIIITITLIEELLLPVLIHRCFNIIFIPGNLTTSNKFHNF